MSKLLKNVIIGVASGAAAAYFLSTEKGKKFQKKAAKAYEAY
ncbi:YtxH domain-containing protein, partial [Enterococcus faecium]